MTENWYLFFVICTQLIILCSLFQCLSISGLNSLAPWGYDKENQNRLSLILLASSEGILISDRVLARTGTNTN